MKWTTDVVHVEPNAITYNIPFVPYYKKEPIMLKDVTSIEDSSLDLPMQQQNADDMKKSFPYLEKVPIPSYSLQKPQILLGIPHMCLLAHASCVTGSKEGDPVAVLTKLGWAVYGTNVPSRKYEQVNKSVAVGFTCIECSSEDISNKTLLEHMRLFNSIENMGIAHKNASLLSEEDQQAQIIINDTMRYNESNKRYEIGLLWRPHVKRMQDNYDQALSRLQASERRLKKLKMDEFVNNQFKEQIHSGWLVETTREEADKFSKRNYVYGFIVFNSNKTPPKPRWVNDTAAKFNGVSLNSMLLKGPDNLVPLQQSLCAVRESSIAYQADVKSMFNQIELRYEDQFSQLCLWRECDSAKSPKIYRQTRVIFGPTCSPAVANAVRITHANNCADKFPRAADVALHQMYVDDVADSRDTIKEAAEVANELIKMFDLIGWPLVEFYSNNSEFLNEIPRDRVGKKIVEIGEEDEQFITKVLGMFWKPRADVYVFRMNDDGIIKKCMNSDYRATKREVLGTIMRIYDPLGLIIPFRIRGLIIMQHIWRTGTDWKSPLTEEVAEEFKTWLKDFEVVTKLQVPRCYFNVPLRECKLEYHVFVDAGTDAYSACVYIRAVHGAEIYVRLVVAKGRVAPLKYMSIPKLELMSGLLGARLLQAVKLWHRRLNIATYTIWTDSMTSYRWIKSPHLPRTPFTAPRISEIQELTSADRWRYVPSKQNVADYGTKQREMDYSDAMHEWYTGPKFLYGPEANWPKQPSNNPPKEAIARVFFVGTIKVAPSIKDGILTGISSKVRSDGLSYTRVVAWALRYVDRKFLKKPQCCKDGQFSSYEMNRAENFILRQVQMAAFPNEFQKLSSGRNVDKSSKLLSLCPIMCEQTGLIRATTRLSSNFPLDQRQPPILPNLHETSDAIAQYYHKLHHHVNDNTIIGAIRARVWIISTRRIVRRTRARCSYCIVRRAKPVHPTGSNLPDFRLDISKKPFYYTGCDLFGPYQTYIKRSKSKETIYVVIFTCMVTRAVYFEVLNDMSTTCFLAALDKLWARRGPIVHIYSDNGRNFCGAAKAIENHDVQNPIMQAVQSSEVEKELLQRKITWHFTPPYTPQFGGTWERLIKDTKRALDASLGKFTVPRSNFEAALAKIETNMNNRPLTDIPVSPKDQVPLTPYLLMQGYQNYHLLDKGCCSSQIVTSGILQLKTAERINALVQTFRSRFIKEYGPVITRASSIKKEVKSKQLKIDDYVIYLDPTQSSVHWPKGIICKIYQGADRKVRVDIKLPSGKILERRSAHRVAKLDIRLENSEAEQQKYEKDLTVAENSKDPSKTTEVQPQSQPNSENSKVKNCTLKQKMECVNKIIFDDDVAPAANVRTMEDPMLTMEEENLFLDLEGKRTIVADNLPPNLGASEIFQIFERFGRVVTIKGTSFDGVRATRCLITFADEFSAISATNYNESLMIVTSGEAYRIKTAFPSHTIRLYNRKLAKSFITLESKIHEEKNKILFITNKQTSKLCTRTVMPIISNACGYVNSCIPEVKFDVEHMKINMSAVDAEIDKIKKVSKVVVSVGASLQRNDANNSIVAADTQPMQPTEPELPRSDSEMSIHYGLEEFEDEDMESRPTVGRRSTDQNAGASTSRIIPKLKRQRRF